jgi:hypothetical protein
LPPCSAQGLLLATDFSFTRFYERAASEGSRWNFAGKLSSDFRAWRARRADEAQERAARRRLAQDEAAALASGHKPNKTSAERVADFMRETDGLEHTGEMVESSAASAIRRAAQVERGTSGRNDDVAPNENVVNASPRPRPASPPEAPSIATTPLARKPSVNARADMEVEEMIRTASVVRTEVADALPTVAAATTKPAALPALPLDYKLPALDFLHEPEPREMQADEELLALSRASQRSVASSTSRATSSTSVPVR